jgi:hypothetical protein
MDMKTTILLCMAVAGGLSAALAAPLTQGTFTEIIKDVATLRTDSTSAPATLNALLQAPERVRTGAESRAELTAPDQTITRIGANTVFSFETAGRAVNLEKGSLLFHSPKGAGGGTIKSGGASAAVLGTTIIVVATADGGFKLIVLEGKGKATLPNGKSVTLKAGQLVFVLPGGKGFSKVLDINLGKLVGGSLLVNGFADQLSSLPLIQAAIEKQNRDIAKGRAKDTGVSPDDYVGWDTPRDGLNAVDHVSYQTAVRLPVAEGQQRPPGQGNGTGGPGGNGQSPGPGGPPQQPGGP